MKISEKKLEQKLASEIRETGGRALKFASPFEAGYPDRLLLLPGGRAVWVEVKAPGRKPTKRQQARIGELRALGFPCYTVDSPDALEALLRSLAAGRDELKPPPDVTGE